MFLQNITSKAVSMATAILLVILFFISSTLTAEAKTIKFYTWRQQEIPLWKYISDNNLIGDIDIEVVWIEGTAYDSKLRIDLQSKGPDLFQGRAGVTWLQQYIDAKVIKPLAKSIDISSMGKSALLSATGKDGKIYGVPFSVQMESVIYNKQVFKDNNINVPNNIKSFDKALAKLAAKGITPIAFGARSAWWLNQVVGEVMTAGLVSDKTSKALIAGKACFTDPEFVATLSKIAGWNSKGYLGDSPLADDYGAMRTAVALGDAAMMIDGVWSSGPSSPMYEINKKLELGFFAIPGKNAKIYAFGDGSYLANSNSKNLSAVNKVLQFTTTRKFAELFAEYVGELPAYGKEYTVKDNRLKIVSNMVANNALSSTPFFAASLNSGNPSYGELVSSGYQELLSGKLTPVQVAKKIQDGLNSWNYIGKKNCP